MEHMRSEADIASHIAPGFRPRRGTGLRPGMTFPEPVTGSLRVNTRRPIALRRGPLNRTAIGMATSSLLPTRTGVSTVAVVRRERSRWETAAVEPLRTTSPE